MDLKDYISIAGLPGLYKLISQGKSVLIVENLETGQRMPSHATNRISSLEEIALFTKGEDKPLKDIFLDIFKKEEGKPTLDPKKASPQELRDYFATIIPEYDRLKVYVSDIKKVLTWYNIMVTSGKVDFSESPAEE